MTTNTSRSQGQVEQLQTWPPQTQTQPDQKHEKSVQETHIPITTSNDQPSSQPIITTTTTNTTNATAEPLKWNSSKQIIFRVLSTFWCFMILGANDAAYGALIPYLEVFYNVDYLTISLIFLAPIVGYVSSALTNDMMHMKFGQRGVGTIMSACHLIAYIIISFHPPYPALVIVFMLSGYGNGLGDSAWNAWIGAMANSNEILGFLHAFYGLGALLSPIIATALITQAGWKWYQFYYLLIGASAIELVILTASFWPCTASVYREQHRVAIEAARQNSIIENEEQNNASGTITPNDDDTWQPAPIEKAPLLSRLNPFSPVFFMNPPPPGTKKPTNSTTISTQPTTRLTTLTKRLHSTSPTYRAITSRITLLTSLFLLLYVGAEVSQGGWLITFLIRVRHATPFAAGTAGTGFWLGVTLGRLILGFVTARCFPTEKHAVLCYLILSVIVQILFWAIPNFIVSSVMAGLLGFLIAPFFPAAVVMLAKNLPSDLHVAAIGFCAALGASGATVLPFAVGAIAQSKGVQVLQPVILALLVGITVIWLLMPSLPRQNGKKEKRREKREEVSV